MKRGFEESWDGRTACRSNDAQEGSSSSNGEIKGKNLWRGADDEMDELLAVLGYKVRSSDMADVAHKLEQLEMALTQDDVVGCGGGGDGTILDDAVHYNPSDLSSWVETMLSEINGPGADPTRIDQSGMDPNRNGSGSEYDDLRAIPGVAAYPVRNDGDEESIRKRMRFGIGSESGSGFGSLEAAAAVESTRAVVLVESQEAGGVRLVHTLMACAEAVQQNNINLADLLLKRVGALAASQSGAMRKVASFFTEALARRIYRIHPRDVIVTEADVTPSAYDDVLEMHFYETSPCLKFAHFTANQAILEAFSTAKNVHVIDLCLKQGVQWPPLLQALALRQDGPPSFRLTGIGPPLPDNSDSLQQVGWNLAQLAQSIGIEFNFKGFVANSLSDLEPQMFETGCTDEAVAVNSVFGLHPLLAHSGAVDKVISTVKSLKPNVFTVVEQEADHNGVVFIDRFNEALHYYSSMFDSLECGGHTGEDRVMSELYLGKQILNIVSAEGGERVERHEVVDRWRTRLGSAGFERVHLGSNAFRQASLLLALFAGRDGFQVEENDGCLMLGWHTRPLIATSAWKPVAESDQ